MLVAACSTAAATSFAPGTADRASSSAGSASAGPLSPASGQSGAEACSLATLAEVSAAIHFTVNVETIGAGGASCTWTFADPNEMKGFNTARLELISPAIFAVNRQDQTDATVTPVTGLGDSAFYVDAGTAGTSLSVEKGSVAFTVSVLGVAYTAAQAKEDEKTLAGYVLARI
jgi:hypothetical protein